MAIMDAKEVDPVLTDVISPRSRKRRPCLRRASTLLVARAAENQSWWRHIYAFRKERC
jgi:hypothetical protein